MLELVLVRHGETLWNRERRVQGQSPNPLSDLGIKQARRLGVRLMDETFDRTFDRVYSSDLPRALQTARLALPEADLVQDARLREISRGVLEGKIDADLTPEEVGVREAMRRDRYGYRPQGGENFADVAARVGAWLDDLPPEGRVIAFTHGGVIHAALRLVLDAPGATSWDFAINNASLTRILFYDDRATIAGMNDHAHLLGRENLWSF